MYETKQVPIFIDKSVPNEFSEIVRFYYFVVTFRETNWKALEIEVKKLLESRVDILKPLALPVIWLESSYRYILSGPLGGGTFNSVQQIDELFDFFDENFVEIETVFHSFENKSKSSHLNIKRGEVYRLDSGIVSSLSLGKSPNINNNNMIASVEETSVFRLWNRSVVDRVKARYRDNPDRTLRKRIKGEDQ